MEISRHGPRRTREWLDSLEAVIDAEGSPRHFLLERLIPGALRGTYLPYNANAVSQHDLPIASRIIPATARSNGASVR